MNNTAIVFALNRKYLKIINDLCTKNNLKLKFIDHCHLASNNILKMNPLNKLNDQLSFYISHKILSVLFRTKANRFIMKIFQYQISMNSVEWSPKTSELNQKQFNFNEAFLFGDSTSKSITKVLTEATGIKFNLVNPFKQLKADTSLLTNKYYTETNHFFSSSAGVAARI